MRTRLEQTKEEQTFVPFNIVITVETLKEARALYHIFNTNEVALECFNSVKGPYSTDFEHDLDTDLAEQIMDEVMVMGLSI